MSPPSMDCTLVFDIDGVLADVVSWDPDRVLGRATELWGEDHVRDHTFMVMDYPHLIYPGMFALWAWLHRRGARIAVFSSGVRERNEALIAAFSARAFQGEEAPSIPVFSREDCLDTESLPPEEEPAWQGLWHGLRKKVLARVVPPERLPSTLLVEDDRSYAAAGEESHVIQVPSYHSPVPFDRRGWTWRSVYKAFYVAGLLETIRQVVEERGCTWAQGALHVQVEREGATLDPRFNFPSRERRTYHDLGLPLLQEVDPTLLFHYEPEGDR